MKHSVTNAPQRGRKRTSPRTSRLRLRRSTARRRDDRRRISLTFQTAREGLNLSSDVAPDLTHPSFVPSHRRAREACDLAAAGACGAGLAAFGRRGRRVSPRDEVRQGSRGILGPIRDRPQGRRRPPEATAVRREQRHPTRASGKPRARSVTRSRNGIFFLHPGFAPGAPPALQLRAKATGRFGASRHRLRDAEETSRSTSPASSRNVSASQPTEPPCRPSTAPDFRSTPN
jgi:hypothetical protein